MVGELQLSCFKRHNVRKRNQNEERLVGDSLCGGPIGVLMCSIFNELEKKSNADCRANL
jgi:hypothetical protein